MDAPGEWTLCRVWGTRRPLFEVIEPRGDRWLLGRETLADDDRMSRRHCEVRLGIGGWVIDDLGSANGTHVNGGGWVGRTPGGPWQVLQIGRSLVIPLQVPADVPLRLRREDDAIVGPGLHRTWEAVGAAAKEDPQLVLAGPRGCGFALLARHHARVRGGSFSVVELERGKQVPGRAPSGVVLVTGVGSIEGYAAHPWVRAALQRDDLRLVLALEWATRQGAATVPRALASRFQLITVPGLDARPEEIPWWIETGVQTHAPEVAIDVTFPEACLLRVWSNGIAGLLAETREALARARLREPQRPFLRARDLSEHAGFPTRQLLWEGLPPPSGPRLPAPELREREDLARALAIARGDRAVAAARLRVTVATLEKWMRHHGIADGE